VIAAVNPIFKNLYLTIGLVALLHFSSIGQCTSATLQSLTYDTLIPGSGNTNHTFSFNKFDPSLGTLVAANISSVVSVNYGFTLQNVETVPRNFQVSVGRMDNFTSSSLVNPYNNLIDTALGTFLLNPGVSFSKPVGTIIYRYVNTDDITSSASNFIGTGSVSFDYEPITYTTLLGSANYYYSASANDTIHFSITYKFCNNITLSSTLTSFTASKMDFETVNLAWTDSNEQQGRNYDIQESNDGIHFSFAGSTPSVIGNNAKDNYYYHYKTNKTQDGLLFFRPKIVDANGLVSYSEIKSVDMGIPVSGDPFIYPNPSSQFINIVFNQSNPSDWQIELISPTGSLLERRNIINANTAHINFAQTFAAGVYFARTINLRTRENHVLSFVVR
jgi:hypothetical protein